MSPFMQARKNRCPARRANRSGDEGILETHAMFRQPIHIRRLDDGMPRAAQGIVSLIVDQEEENVGQT